MTPDKKNDQNPSLKDIYNILLDMQGRLTTVETTMCLFKKIFYAITTGIAVLLIDFVQSLI